MKAKPRILPPVSQSRRAVALIIVLAILLLMSALLVAFMGTVSNEREAARSMTAGFEAKQAYETAVNLVMTQIREATKNDDGKVGWASQPGVIHNFGTENKQFKLYSDDVMQQDTSAWNPGSIDESGFDPSKPEFTPTGMVDLNLPVFVPVPGSTTGEVEPHYPIADPRAGRTATGAAASAPGKGIVEGFFGADITHPTLKEKGGSPVRLLPMRVRWMYQLKDGQLVVPDQSGILKNASKENPPVARMAFWTDDETSKINVNTAGEGTYWDVPLASSYRESGQIKSDGSLDLTRGKTGAFSASQPTNKEYQRYGGHPATTNLSSALRWLFATPTVANDVNNDTLFKEAIYRLAPRITGGYASSMSATVNPDDGKISEYRQFDRDRLFATLDEYWFRPDRSPLSENSFYRVYTDISASYIADPKFLDKTKFTPAALEKMRFFLSAVSRASDLNLFGKPRVSIWPVHEVDNPDPKSSKRSGFDDLMVFCSTIAKKPYIFSRANPWSPTYDYELSGAQTQSGSSPNLKRNKSLIDYLRYLSDQPIPATQTSFTGSGKYGNAGPGGFVEMDQILLEIFDYIRSTNTIETGRKDNTSLGYPLAYTQGYTPNGDLTGNTKPNPGSGQVIPTVIYDKNTGKPSIKGFGRNDTVSEVGLIFYADTTALPIDKTGTPEGAAPDQNSYLSFRCAILTEFFTVAPGYLGLSEAFAYTIKETSPFTISSIDGSFSQQLSLAENRTDENNINFVGVDAWRGDSGRFFMPTRGIYSPFLYDAGIYKPGDVSDPARKIFAKNVTTSGGEAAYSKYPFYSKRVDMAKSGGVAQPMKFSGGTLVIDIYPLDIDVSTLSSPSIYAGANMKQPIQTITVIFPPITELPTPKPGKQPFHLRFPAKVLAEDKGGPSALRGTTYATQIMYDQFDVVRSIEINGPTKADYRHVAGLANPPADYFVPSGGSGNYADPKLYLVHNIRSGWGSDYPEGVKYYGSLTPNPDPRKHKNGVNAGAGGIGIKMPDIHKNINGVPSMDSPPVCGDFDRGFSKQTDGPFINKPDEGNTRNVTTDDFTGGGGLAYFRGDQGTEVVGKSFFSPNRMVSSPVMFGSLSSGIFEKRPWETLLFSPPVGTAHRGARSPADHYLLDWFTMPVVEPFAISEPLSTMGRINLNARLAPFGYAKDSKTGRSYIERNTGLHAVLKNLKQFVAANNTPECGHAERPLTGSTNDMEFRFDIDPYLTIDKAITPRFDNNADPTKSNGYFKSATQICEIDLLMSSGKVFDDPTPAKRKAFWEANQMTGDNAREKPYSLIYPRLTTKSNVYTVHVWSQSLAKNPNSTSDEWRKFDENRDKVTGEFRGSTTIERFLDANDPALVPTGAGAPYDATDPKSKGLDPYYRFRILSSKRFTMQ